MTRTPPTQQMVPPNNRHWRRSLLSVLLGVAFLAGPITGCGKPSADEMSPVGQVTRRPLSKMRSAINNGQWDLAWQYRDAVLAQHADDANVIALVAQVAGYQGDSQAVIDLLVKACEAEKFATTSRVQQTMVAMIGVGQSWRATEWLETVVAARPDEYTIRRWLFDLYIGTERLHQARPHGRYLVRQRQFDSSLLLALAGRFHRTKDLTYIKTLYERNPNDNRVLIREAIALFDANELDSSEKRLSEIHQSYPDFASAALWLGKVYAANHQMDQLREWINAQPQDIRKRSGYWLIVAQSMPPTQDIDQRTRCFWEAAKRDATSAQAWNGLNDAVEQLLQADLERVGIDDNTRRAIAGRAANAKRLDRAMDRFQRSGRISVSLSVQISQWLMSLGRPWEAEAWASIAIGLPADDAIDPQVNRDGIVKQMTAEMPWQITNDSPELKIDLSQFPLPGFLDRLEQ